MKNNEKSSSKSKPIMISFAAGILTCACAAAYYGYRKYKEEKNMEQVVYWPYIMKTEPDCGFDFVSAMKEQNQEQPVEEEQETTQE